LTQEKEQKKHGFKLFAINSALRLAYLIIQVWELNSPRFGGAQTAIPHSTPKDYSTLKSMLNLFNANN
jgi:hypothetical protein